MKLLWVKADFLHPTNRGGQIRSLEMLKRLHRRHEVHFLAFDRGGDPEGPARAHEYSSFSYPIPHAVPEKRSPAFAAQLVKGLYDPLPVAVARYRSAAMRRKVEQLTRDHRFDHVVCDFLFPAPNIPDPSAAVLFEHNVESVIWHRHVEHAGSFAKRAYFRMQAARMERFEGEMCRRMKSVIAVSEIDAEAIRGFGAKQVSSIPTGVDIEYFAGPERREHKADLVFVGSMDWMANIDGARWFVREALPLIRKHRPECTLALAGRKPSAELADLARIDAGIAVTGTVPDIRPWMWGAAVSIVPLRVGGGTRLKIYEAMAARVPVVSTSIGAEGLDVTPGTDILIADSSDEFARACIELLDDAERRRALCDAAWRMVSERYSWEAVACRFESALGDAG